MKAPGTWICLRAGKNAEAGTGVQRLVHHLKAECTHSPDLSPPSAKGDSDGDYATELARALGGNVLPGCLGTVSGKKEWLPKILAFLRKLKGHGI